MLNDGDPEVRIATARIGFELYNYWKKPFPPELIDILNDPDPHIRAISAVAIAQSPIRRTTYYPHSSKRSITLSRE